MIIQINIYIKFGFPFSIEHPDLLINTKVVDHHVTLQYRDAVLHCQKKTLVPFWVVPTIYILPLTLVPPLLTRPKDINDRRVILNKLYPKGQSLGDHVDKCNFNSRPLFIYLFYLSGVLRRFQHCTGLTGSWKGRGNQYIQFVRVLYCKLPTNSKELPAFPLEAILGIKPRPHRWEARVLPLCHRGPWHVFHFEISFSG